jgi:hypothetical protein
MLDTPDPEGISPPEAPALAPVSYLAEPLDDFYRIAGLPLPAIEAVPDSNLPEPYRTLLVHQSDMTSTLEKFHRRPLRIEVLSRKREADFYYREVLLVIEEWRRNVEFGAIKISLGSFPRQAQEAILEEKLPLGSILHRYNLEYLSRPKAYLRIRSDEFINKHLRLTTDQWLYGRRNTLFLTSGGILAEIVEILPP